MQDKSYCDNNDTDPYVIKTTTTRDLLPHSIRLREMSELIIRVLLRRPTSQTFRFTPIRTLIVPRRHGVRIRTNHPFARFGARICRGHSAHRHARVRRRFLIHIVCIRFIEGQFLRVLREGKRTKFPKFQIFDVMMMRFCNHHHRHHHRL